MQLPTKINLFLFLFMFSETRTPRQPDDHNDLNDLYNLSNIKGRDEIRGEMNAKELMP
jgi:hypothetical protein